jgi:hypothetical protein
MMANWEWDKSRPPPSEGQGAWVKHGAELGYAKLDRLASERLGAKLGKMVQVPVADVKSGKVEGEEAVISRVRSTLSASLAEFDLSDASICEALREASGLIPLLLWIGSGDHGKAGNFVATPNEQESIEIEAIDFGSCFEWRGDGLSGVGILSELMENADRQQVERTLQNIENVSDTAIQQACRDSGMNNYVETAAELIRRRHLLRDWLRL